MGKRQTEEQAAGKTTEQAAGKHGAVTKQTLGRRGEEAACGYLEKKGYEIIERNFRCVRGEIDIIAALPGTLVFVEVKTRRGVPYGLPCEAVTRTKMRHMRTAAAYYMRIRGLERFGAAVRFDVVEVLELNGRLGIRHIEAAF